MDLIKLAHHTIDSIGLYWECLNAARCRGMYEGVNFVVFKDDYLKSYPEIMKSLANGNALHINRYMRAYNKAGPMLKRKMNRTYMRTFYKHNH